MTLTEPPVAPAPRPTPPSGAKATVSLILGIISLFLNPLWATSVIGGILGIIALRNRPSSGDRNKAIAGIVLSAIGLISSIVVFFGLIAAIGGAASAGAESATVATPATRATPASENTASDAAGSATAASASGEKSYTDVNDLYSDAVAAGFECNDFTVTNNVKAAEGSGACDDGDGDVLSIYSDASSRDAAVSAMDAFLNALGGQDTTLLVGRNWVINSKNAEGLQATLGGKIQHVGVDPATTGSNDTADDTSSEPDVPVEYLSALNKAQSYSDNMHMSRRGIYEQLTSEYGEQFTKKAAKYAVAHVDADWNANALAKAKSYQEDMSMSPAAIRDQLTSSYGEQFTPAQADYAIRHLND